MSALIKNGLSQWHPFSWDSFWVYHPRLVTHKKKHYLFYTGKNFKKGISHQIGVAISSDLISWEKHSSPVLKSGGKGSWDSDFTAHPFIYKEKNTFFMLYDGSKKGKWHESIGLAQSQDLIHWEKYSNPIFVTSKNVWEKKHVSRACIYKEKDTYYMYYTGHDGLKERIGLAYGKDIFHLKRYSQNPVIDVGSENEWDENFVCDPKVIKYKEKYLVFYSGIDKNNIEKIGMAVSTDLFHWKKYKSNPIFDGGSRFDIVGVKDDKVQIIYSKKSLLFWDIRSLFLKIKL